MKRRAHALWLVGLLALTRCGLSACAGSGCPVPLAQVDLPRMAGGWYIVATIPNRLEHGIIAGYDHFTVMSASSLHEDFYFQTHSFQNSRHHATTTITVEPNTANADWRVHLIWPVVLPFQVIYVDPAYKYALFGEQNRQWGWIYARTQQIPDADYRSLLSRFKTLGWDTTKFRKFVQTPSQIGEPDYWSDSIR